MVKYGCIYRLTCSVNKKKYIGQSCDFKSRMSKHKCTKFNSPISKDIQKYGWNAFKQEIVVDNIPKKDLGKLENYYIEAEDTLIPNGYNVKKNRWGVYFVEREKRWRAYGPNRKHIGYYFTKEKTEQAVKLYKETGERMKSDVHMRKRGTGSIRKNGKRYVAVIKRKSKTFDTIEECEEWLKNDERMESDKCTRKKGTGTIRKRGKRYLAQITINKKRYYKSFYTIEQCEAWLKSRLNN